MLKPKKSLGQNFLIDQNIVSKIVSLEEIYEKNIIEIGPGTGNLTKEIIKQKPKNLILIEKDKKLYAELKRQFKDFKQVKIYNEDVLKFNFENEIKNETIIYGNLPYNISTKILTNLIKFKIWPPKYIKLILMFQKEVAEKILANYKTPNYGRLRIMSNYRLSACDNFNISNNCFYPKPKIDSTVISFDVKRNPKIKIDNIKNLETVTNIFFSGKRKMINKPLKKLFIDFKKISTKLNLDLSVRPSEISEIKYYEIAKLYEKKLD
tara:strand:+ start:228 stop:1022 length:795 start_codon:yes stop_codon:yes gene_type:complete